MELHDNDTAPRHALLRVRVPRKLRRRMSLAQALGLSITITSCAIMAAAAAVTYTDPEPFPHLGVGLWWAAATVTTVGYGDVVPSSPGGRLIGAVLMFLGIASLALLTAIAASAIVVGEVRSEEREIEKEETEILSELRKLTSGFPGSKASPTNTSNLREGPLIRLGSGRRTIGSRAAVLRTSEQTRSSVWERGRTRRPSSAIRARERSEPLDRASAASGAIRHGTTA